MNFDVSPEQRELAASLRDVLAAADVPSVARAWALGDYGPGRALWSKLAAMGVAGITIPEGHGGFGGNAVDLVLCLEELGRAAVPGPWVESLAVLPALLSARDEVARIATGEQIATLAAPPETPYACDGRAADAVYVLTGSLLRQARVVDDLVSVDAVRRLARVEPAAEVGTVDPSVAARLGELGTTAQILGAGRSALDRAVTYAKQRHQFGKPIGAQQAVKHQLADAHVGLELARPLMLAAALSMTQGSATAARDVSAAKVACTDAAYRAARASLQVHGAIGYTAEYDLSLWVTKIRALMSAWGTPAQHRARVLEAIR